MTIKVYMTKEEKKIAKSYARSRGVSLRSDLKDTFFKKIEDEYDIALAELAIRECQNIHLTKPKKN